jgi:hypothetical protein
MKSNGLEAMSVPRLWRGRRPAARAPGLGRRCFRRCTKGGTFESPAHSRAACRRSAAHRPTTAPDPLSMGRERLPPARLWHGGSGRSRRVRDPRKSAASPPAQDPRNAGGRRPPASPHPQAGGRRPAPRGRSFGLRPAGRSLLIVESQSRPADRQEYLGRLQRSTGLLRPRRDLRRRKAAHRRGGLRRAIDITGRRAGAALRRRGPYEERPARVQAPQPRDNSTNSAARPRPLGAARLFATDPAREGEATRVRTHLRRVKLPRRRRIASL